MVVGFLALGVAEAWADAPTFDEPVYVSAGLAGVLHHDVTLNEEHPPLPKVLAVLPVLFVRPVVPADGGWGGQRRATLRRAPCRGPARGRGERRLAARPGLLPGIS